MQPIKHAFAQKWIYVYEDTGESLQTIIALYAF